MRGSRFILPILLASSALAAPRIASGQIVVGLSITIAPPALPIYVQPVIPAEGYLWTPGYWAYGSEGYFWVPGTWVLPPSVGMLWTPGYWGWNNGVYAFNAGYWGPHVGFYGGINYGFGYGGSGYEGGRWNNGAFAYNQAVNNVGSTHITNVYNQTVITNNHTTVNNVSFNGGTGGVAARPTPAEVAVAHEAHVAPTPVQAAHVQAAQGDRTLLASVNHGAPAVAATPRPGELHAAGVVPARPVAPAARPALAGAPMSHAPGSPVAAASAPHPLASGAPHPVPAAAPHPVTAAAPHPVAATAPPHPQAPQQMNAPSHPPVAAAPRASAPMANRQPAPQHPQAAHEEPQKRPPQQN